MTGCKRSRGSGREPSVTRTRMHTGKAGEYEWRVNGSERERETRWRCGESREERSERQRASTGVRDRAKGSERC